MATLVENVKTLVKSIQNKIELIDSTKVSKTGDILSGDLVPNGNGTLNLGSTTAQWNGFFKDLVIEGNIRGGNIGGGEHVGSEKTIPANTPFPGWLDESINHGQLVRATTLALWEFARDSGNITTDTEWLAEVAAHGSCGKFSSGDGSTTFRIPFLRRVYIRLHDPDTGLQVGQYQDDAFQGHSFGDSLNGTGVLASVISRIPTSASAATSSYATISPRGTAWSTAAGSFSKTMFSEDLDGNGVPRTANETRGKTIVRLPIIKAFDTVQNPAMIEVSGLVTQLGMTNDHIAVSQQVMEVEQRLAVNVYPGTFTSGAWYDRVLDSLVANSILGASLANNQITLPVGAYDIFASAPGYSVSNHTIRFISLDGTLNYLGANSYAPVGIKSRSELNRRVILTSPTTFKLQHMCTVTHANQGFGVASSITDSITSKVKIWRIS